MQLFINFSFGLKFFFEFLEQNKSNDEYIGE